MTVDIWAAVSMEKKKAILIISPESISRYLKTMRFVNLLLFRQLRKTIKRDINVDSLYLGFPYCFSDALASVELGLVIKSQSVTIASVFKTSSNLLAVTDLTHFWTDLSETIS